MISPVGNCLASAVLARHLRSGLKCRFKEWQKGQLGKCQQLSEHHCAEDHKDVHLAAVGSIVPAGPFC